MSVTKQEPPVSDPRKMDYEQLDALARESLDAEVLSEYQCSVLEAYLEQERRRRVERRMKEEAKQAAKRRIDRAAQQAAKRDLQRWLKWQREVGLHREFARDYARYMARISC